MNWYLAGAIGFETGTEYIDWRNDMTAFLKSIGHGALNPLKKYEPTGGAGDVKDFFNLMRKNEAFDKIRQFMQTFVIPPDIKMVDEGHGVIAYVTSITAGTQSEITYAHLNGKPVLIVTPLPKEQWPNWMVGCSTAIFEDFDNLKHFLQFGEAKCYIGEITAIALPIECESLHCELKRKDKELPTAKPKTGSIILCPFYGESLENPLVQLDDDTRSKIMQLKDVIDVCPAVHCMQRRGMFCLTEAQLKKIEEKRHAVHKT